MTEPYTVAVISDIHGNLAALSAVLSDLESSCFDELLVAGDLALFGPNPLECTQCIQELNAPTIYGNTDQYISDPDHERYGEPGMQWVRDKIGADAVQYLSDLPFHHRVTPPGGSTPGDDLLLVHATPTSVEAMWILEPDSASSRPLTSESYAKKHLGDSRANLILYGHIHICSSGTVSGQRVASVGSVGLPLDLNHHAAYALMSWDGQTWSVEHQRVKYDHEAVAVDLEMSDAPFAANSAAIIRQARLPA